MGESADDNAAADRAAEAIANGMEEVCRLTPSRARSLVQTKLDEAMMWLTRARPAENGSEVAADAMEREATIAMRTAINAEARAASRPWRATKVDRKANSQVEVKAGDTWDPSAETVSVTFSSADCLTPMGLKTVVETIDRALQRRKAAKEASK